MSEDQLHEIFRDIEERYKQRTPKSAEHNARAKHRLPGGDTRTATFYQPYPVYMIKGKGCNLYDIDGNQYIDMLNNYTSLIHGHAHPKIIEAARAQLENGSVFGSATETQYLHAEHLCARVPSLDLVRYGNSGTEGTMFAMRAARAFTGKDMFIKMDGGYHGSHDFIEVNVFPGSGSERGADGLPVRHVEAGWHIDGGRNHTTVQRSTASHYRRRRAGHPGGPGVALPTAAKKQLAGRFWISRETISCIKTAPT